MYVAIATYSPAPEKKIEDIEKAFEASISFFSSIPGLIKKYYCFNEELFQGTSVYIWESKEAAEAVYNSDVFNQRFVQSFGCTPEVQIVPIKQVVDNG